MKFNQSPGEFVKSKTNLAGIALILFSIGGFAFGKVTYNEAALGITNGFGMIGIRDKLAQK